MHPKMDRNRDCQEVRFNEGLLTGSTELLEATKFYQNCFDEDTESRWMEFYEETKANNQATFKSVTAENNQINELNVSNERDNTDLSTTYLEKTHSAEPKIGQLFKSHLKRCNEMNNLDKTDEWKR
ncbi:unnamed protein product [Thelazia callipaeda]|uniref:RGS domain-containing protein n=1 Tax=Thelazia callipaeda TaxID=103827 RepID=A0A0N5CLD3_THECL|nr:unnamed protein product [Thelazia callipaeda]